MELDNFQKLYTKLEDLQTIYGLGIAATIVITAIIFVFAYKFLDSKVKAIAEEASGRALQTFQAQLNKDFYKFQSTHQKQLDAIHKTFEDLQNITSTIDYMMKGEKFTQHTNSNKALGHLMQFRHDFKQTFQKHRLIFPEELCNKIELLIPTIDDFIETYQDGLMPEPSNDEIGFESENGDGLYLAGIWKQGAFDDILNQLGGISNDIEVEFRKIYGT